MLRVDDAKVDNDYNGIFTEMLRSESDVIGKSFKIPDCRRFIPQKTNLSSNQKAP
jgi:hypothetical protein